MDQWTQLAIGFHLIHLEGVIFQALALDQEVARVSILGRAGVTGSATVQALVQDMEAALALVQEEEEAAGMEAAWALVWDRVVDEGGVLMLIHWHQSGFIMSPC